MPITLILTLAILLITSLGIGSAVLTLLAPKLKLHPAESLCIAIALSWLTVFQLAFAAFAFGHFSLAPIPTFILSLLSLVIARKQLLRWLKYPFTRAMLAAFSLLLAWHLLNQSGVITYSWAIWYGDWYEHYQRMLFYIQNQPLDTRFLNDTYTLAARPPMQNVCQAYVASLTNTAFSGFQTSSTFLATLLALPVFLLTRRMAQGPRLSLWVAAALLAATWPFLIAALFTWTKGFAGFYALLGLALYLRPPSRQRDILVFLAMGAGIVVHYSIALILIPLLLWHASTFLSQPRKLPAAVAAGIPGVLVLLPWLLFIKLALPHSILGATSSADLFQRVPPTQAALWCAHNALGALLPIYPPRAWSVALHELTSQNLAATRNILFMMLQHTYLLSIGLVGLLVAGLQAHRAWSLRKRPPQLAFWLWMLLATALCMGISHPTLPDFGIAQIALLPMIVFISAWAAGLWPTLAIKARIALLACALLQFIPILIDASIFTSTPRLSDGATPPGFDPHRAYDISNVGQLNLILKYANQLTFLADPLAPHLQTLFYAITLFALAWLTLLARQIKPNPHRSP